MASAQRRKKLIKWIRVNELTRREAAIFFNVSIHSMHAYLRPVDNASNRHVPDHIWSEIKNV